MKTSFKRLGAGIAGVAALGLATFGVIQLSPIGAASASDTTGVLSTKTATTVSSVYAATQQTTDKLPNFLLSGPQSIDGIVPSSTHLLGDDDGTKAWAALNDQGQACLVTLLPGTEQWASSTCASPGDFAQKGIGLQAATQNESSRLYFVPSGYGSAPGLTQVGPQLLSGNAHVDQTSAPVLKKATSGATARSTSASAPSTVELLPFRSVEDLRQ